MSPARPILVDGAEDFMRMDVAELPLAGMANKQVAGTGHFGVPSPQAGYRSERSEKRSYAFINACQTLPSSSTTYFVVVDYRFSVFKW